MSLSRATDFACALASLSTKTSHLKKPYKIMFHRSQTSTPTTSASSRPSRASLAAANDTSDSVSRWTRPNPPRTASPSKSQIDLFSFRKDVRERWSLRSYAGKKMEFGNMQMYFSLMCNVNQSIHAYKVVHKFHFTRS
jgi:hypothetical protein